MSLFLYRFPLTLLFLFRFRFQFQFQFRFQFRFRFLYLFPFLFWIPVSCFSRRPQHPVASGVTFAPGQPENLSFFHRNNFLGTLDFTGTDPWLNPSIFLRAQP